MKRFLALFAIVALIVSMFSGVGFAAAGDIVAGNTYILTATDTSIVKGSDAEDITVNVTESAAPSAHLDEYTLAVYDSSDNLQAVEKAIVTDGTSAVLDGADLATLPAGTYTITVKGTLKDGSTYYIDKDGVTGYDPAADVTITHETFTVVDVNESISNITAGQLVAQIIGNITADSEAIEDGDLALYVKSTTDAYEALTSASDLFVDSTGTDFVGAHTAVAVGESTITDLYIDTVDLLQATFDHDSDSDASTTDITIWEFFSSHNTTGTIDMRLEVSGVDLDNDGDSNEVVNIDFTYSAIPLEIELNDDMFYFDNNGGNITISGKIINKNSEAVYDYDSDNLEVIEDNAGNKVFVAGTDTDEAAGQVDSVNNGQFDITFNAYNEDNGIEFFWVYTSDNAPTRGDYFFTTNGAASFVLTPEFELSSDLNFEFPFSGIIEIDGTFINEDNNSTDGTLAKDDIQIAYLDGANEYVAGTNIATSVLANTSSFGFLDGGDNVTKTGDIGLFFKGVRVMKGEVTPGTLSVELGADEVQNNLGDQELSFIFNLGSDYFDTDNDYLNSNYHIIVMIEDEDGTAIDITGAETKFNADADDDLEYVTVEDYDLTMADYVVIVDDTNNSHEFTSSQEVVVKLPVGSWDKGTYTAYVKLYDDSAATVVEETSVEFEVEKPAAYNLIGWSLDEISVGTTTFTFNASGSADQKVVVKDDDGIEIEYLEVVFNGCGLDDKTFANPAYDSDDAEDFEISVSETGTIEVKVNIYSDENDDTPDKTFTEEIKVTGWNVTVTPSELVVGSEEDIVFTIADEDGNPVNNAVITVNDVEVVNGTTSSIIGGVYTYEYDEDTFATDTVGEFDVKFFKGSASEPEVTLTGGIEVIGEEVYTVSVDNSVLLNGLEEEVFVTVLDEAGDIVYPTFYRIDVDSDGDEGSAVEITGADLGSYKDLDGVTGKEARGITIAPDGSQTAVIIRAVTDDGAKMGEVRIEVQTPQVVMTGSSKLTENFKNGVEFTVIDPRDNSELTQDVYLKGNLEYVDYSVKDADDADVAVDSEGKSAVISFDDNYKFEVFVNDIDWDQSESDEADVEVALYLELDTDVKLLDLAVAKAQLTSDPEVIIIGSSTNITLTYVDAEGNPLEGYDVELDGEEVGETDENGQVVYSASSTSSVSLEFTVDTDDSDSTDSNITTPHADNTDSTTASLKIKSSADTQAPVVTYEVQGSSAIITITDNVRLLKSFVNNTEVDMYFPMPSVTHVVTGLKVGENKLQVLSSDTKGNILDTTLVITVEATKDPVNFTIGEETEYGVPVLKNDTTMVPVRFAEDLGATVEWNNETKTVTYSLGQTTISMTNGSKTAIVNGVNTQLAVAPYLNESGRTMVPLRMIAQELGFTVNWTSNSEPITIE